MSRKNLSLEIALVVSALLVAFVVQAVISHTKPPKMPEFETSSAASEEPGDRSASVMSENGVPSNAIPQFYSSHLSALGHAPRWRQLDLYQQTVSKEDFVRLLSTVYTVGSYWEDWFIIGDDHVLIRTHGDDLSKMYKLNFASTEGETALKKFWRTRSELEISSENKPLLGLKIAIDPGHIGGDYAEVEQRKFILSEGTPPIQEGDMTLIVAEQLVSQLESLGASVDLIRDKNMPVNPFRSQDYYSYAKAKLEDSKLVVTEQSVKREAEKLFYRNGEIRARAELVNNEIKPDLVLCLHFNAAAQPEPDLPQLLDNEHFHMILSGAYTKAEMAHDDERFQCVYKILQGNHQEEAKLAVAAAESFRKHSGLSAYQYAVGSSRAVNVGGNPYLWGRNLIANRLYDCPVLYFEPYLMNGKDSYARMQMGDYSGLAFVNGKLRPSIYREYVNAVTEGLVNYYTAGEAAEEKPAEILDDSKEEKPAPILSIMENVNDSLTQR